FKLLLVSILVVTAVLLATTIYIGVSEYNYRFVGVVLKDGTLKVRPHTTFEQVAQMLQDKGFIASKERMVRVAGHYDVDTAQVGNYALTKGSSWRSLLVPLAAGHQSPVRLTFNNIRTLEQLAFRVSRYTLADSADFMRLFCSDSLMQSRSLTPQTLISMFLPNTYEVYWTITPEEFVQKMGQEWDRFWNSRRRNKASELGFTPLEISILASLVYQETKKEEDMTPVAGVYINRLRRGMPLQADPTVKFAVGNFGLKRILHRHLAVDSPYNTYKHTGLPPGPICLPPIVALEATLDYQGHNYYYFCASAEFDGSSRFAATLAEHSRNARAYQAELNRRKIK
ncbi:MAG: endolytic transglycosylase MltG, partial [Mucinivorans sp.]